jgi:hypothetical protein
MENFVEWLADLAQPVLVLAGVYLGESSQVVICLLWRIINFGRATNRLKPHHDPVVVLGPFWFKLRDAS